MKNIFWHAALLLDSADRATYDTCGLHGAPPLERHAKVPTREPSRTPSGPLASLPARPARREDTGQLHAHTTKSITQSMRCVTFNKHEEDLSLQGGVFGLEYWNNADRRKASVRGVNGRLFYLDSGAAPKDGTYMYAYHPDGRFYIGAPCVHSQFLSGMAVQSAGHLHIEGSRIKSIDNASGHYTPSIQEFFAAMRNAAQSGLIVSTTILRDHLHNDLGRAGDLLNMPTTDA